jgi:hypothetical protein
MKVILSTLFLCIALVVDCSFAQTIRSLGYNTTNGRVVYSGTNALTFTNDATFSSVTAPSIKDSSGTRALDLENFSLTFGTNYVLEWTATEARFAKPLTFLGENTASTTRTNLGLGATNLPTFRGIEIVDGGDEMLINGTSINSVAFGGALGFEEQRLTQDGADIFVWETNSFAVTPAATFYTNVTVNGTLNVNSLLKVDAAEAGPTVAVVDPGTSEVATNSRATLHIKSDYVTGWPTLVLQRDSIAAGAQATIGFGATTSDSTTGDSHIIACRRNTSFGDSDFIFILNKIERLRLKATGLLQFGGTNNTFPAVKRDSTTLRIRLADDTADAGLSASTLALSDNLTLGSGDNIILSTTTGTKIGTAANQLLGFYNQTPIAQPSSTGVTTNGFVGGGGGNTVHAQSTFTGGIGTNAYTISDIVAHLKSLGLVAP